MSMRSNRLYFGVGRYGPEDLTHIDFALVVGKTVIPEHDPHWGVVCQFPDQRLGNAIIEARHQSGVIDEEYGFVLYGFAADRQGQINAPIEQNLEQ